MNQKFSDNVTSTAFSLSLSKRQVWMMTAIDAGYPYWENSWAVWCCQALQNKGLLFHGGKGNGYGLTETGDLVVGLLKDAGIYDERLKQGQAANEF